MNNKKEKRRNETRKKNWVFCDGDLPPAGGDPAFAGHEALMITNITDKDAHIRLEIYFEGREPEKNVTLTLKARRTACLRLDKPIGDQKYQIPFGQYALAARSDTPVCACFGRLDVWQNNMAYYSLSGYSV
ncbi:MAG: hypothetical protein LBL66_00955 [Clostridiales bacterium]|jgi:hypothetical protein|nr:hypothetical protein [Clostridiales bacterium]